MTNTGNPTRARSEADALWGVYESTCATSGTPEQRKWAFQRALAAEDRAAKLERVAHARAAALKRAAA